MHSDEFLTEKVTDALENRQRYGGGEGRYPDGAECLPLGIEPADGKSAALNLHTSPGGGVSSRSALTCGDPSTVLAVCTIGSKAWGKLSAPMQEELVKGFDEAFGISSGREFLRNKWERKHEQEIKDWLVSSLDRMDRPGIVDTWVNNNVRELGSREFPWPFVHRRKESEPNLCNDTVYSQHIDNVIGYIVANKLRPHKFPEPNQFTFKLGDWELKFEGSSRLELASRCYAIPTNSGHQDTDHVPGFNISGEGWQKICDYCSNNFYCERRLAHHGRMGNRERFLTDTDKLLSYVYETP